MDSDEWALWRQHLPETQEWLAADTGRAPERVECLRQAEARAFAFTADRLERFRALVSCYKPGDFVDEELELILRILLLCREGRHTELRFGEAGRRLLRTAERRHHVASAYLDAFRRYVEAELE